MGCWYIHPWQIDQFQKAGLGGPSNSTKVLHRASQSQFWSFCLDWVAWFGEALALVMIGLDRLRHTFEELYGRPAVIRCPEELQRESHYLQYLLLREALFRNFGLFTLLKTLLSKLVSVFWPTYPIRARLLTCYASLCGRTDDCHPQPRLPDLAARFVIAGDHNDRTEEAEHVKMRFDLFFLLLF